MPYRPPFHGILEPPDGAISTRCSHRAQAVVLEDNLVEADVTLETWSRCVARYPMFGNRPIHKRLSRRLSWAARNYPPPHSTINASTSFDGRSLEFYRQSRRINRSRNRSVVVENSHATRSVPGCLKWSLYNKDDSGNNYYCRA